MRKPVKPGGGLFVFKETMQYSEAKYDAKGVFLLWKGRLVSGGHRTDPRSTV